LIVGEQSLSGFDIIQLSCHSFLGPRSLYQEVDQWSASSLTELISHGIE
jgi:hypothetical protein